MIKSHRAETVMSKNATRLSTFSWTSAFEIFVVTTRWYIVDRIFSEFSGSRAIKRDITFNFAS